MYLYLDISLQGIVARTIKSRSKINEAIDETFLPFDAKADCNSFNEDLADALNHLVDHLDLDSCNKALVLLSGYFFSFQQVRFPFKSCRKISQVIDFELESLQPTTSGNFETDFIATKLPGSEHTVLSSSIDSNLLALIRTFLNQHRIKPEQILPKQMVKVDHIIQNGSAGKDFLFLEQTDDEIFLMLVYGETPALIRSFISTTFDSDAADGLIHQTLLGFKQQTGLNTEFKVVDNRVIDNPPEFSAEFKHVFNFADSQENKADWITHYGRQLAASIILTLCALSLFLLTVHQESNQLQKNIQVIDNKALEIYKSSFPNEKKIQDPYLQMKANTKSILNDQKQNPDQTIAESRPQYTPIHVIQELSSRIPGSVKVKVTRFLFNPETIVISGSTDNFNTVDQLKKKVEESPLFQRVDISSAVSGKRAGEIDFKLNIEM